MVAPFEKYDHLGTLLADLSGHEVEGVLATMRPDAIARLTTAAAAVVKARDLENAHRLVVMAFACNSDEEGRKTAGALEDIAAELRGRCRT